MYWILQLKRKKCHLQFTACGVKYWTLQLKRKKCHLQFTACGVVYWSIGLFSWKGKMPFTIYSLWGYVLDSSWKGKMPFTVYILCPVVLCIVSKDILVHWMLPQAELPRVHPMLAIVQWLYWTRKMWLWNRGAVCGLSSLRLRRLASIA